MTRSNRGARALALAALVAVAGCRKSEPAPAPPPPVEAARSLAAIVASCASAAGTVEVRRAGQGAWEAVAPGSVFRVGDEVRTAALASARIEFLSGGGLELEESADVFIDTAPPGTPAPGEAAPAAEPRVAVKEGVVHGFLPEAAGSTATSRAALVIAVGDGEDVRLASQAGATATFRLSRKARGTEVAVTSGKATLEGAGGVRSLAAGQLAVASAAGVTEAVELVDFPQSVEPGIDARVHLVPGLTVRLAWKPVAAAAAYRVQIARDLSFQGVVRSAVVDGTELSFAPKEPGMFAWRVASVDREQRQGEFGFARRIYCEERPPVDLLVGPADAAVVRFTEAPPRVAFTWASSGEAQPYRLVLASGPDLLGDRVASTVVNGQRAQLEIPAAGEYWWGVYQGGDEQGAGKPLQPIFSKARRLHVVKVAKPRVTAPRAITRWGD